MKRGLIKHLSEIFNFFFPVKMIILFDFYKKVSNNLSLVTIYWIKYCRGDLIDLYINGFNSKFHHF